MLSFIHRKENVFVFIEFTKWFRDYWQKINHAYWILCYKNPLPPIPNRQYQAGCNTNQNKMKIICPFYIAFQVLKVYKTNFKIKLPDIFFLSFYISFTSPGIIFKTSFNIIRKKWIRHRFFFSNEITQIPPPPNGQNPLMIFFFYPNL